MYLIDQNGIAQMKDVSRLDATGAYGAGWRCPLWTQATAALIANPIPGPFCPGSWQWTEAGWSLIRLPEGYLEVRMTQVDAERDRRITQGKPHRFPDGTTGTVQLRHERDTGNINAVATSGTALVIAGDTQARVAFRDAEDVTHEMAGSEAVAFGLAVMAWVSAHYAAAWAHKDAIRTLAQGDDLDAFVRYEITQGWPAEATEVAAVTAETS